jgi:hypothetical protein
MTHRSWVMVCVLWLTACAHQPSTPCSGPFEPVNPPHREVEHG